MIYYLVVITVLAGFIGVLRLYIFVLPMYILYSSMSSRGTIYIYILCQHRALHTVRPRVVYYFVRRFDICARFLF
jgi:hypothetical protein